MPQHRRKEVLPKRILKRVKDSESSPFFGNVHFIEGGGIIGSRCGLVRPIMPNGEKPKHGTALDVQYSLKDGVLTRTEFIRGEPNIPVHIAHFDSDSGRRFSTVLDLFSSQ